MYHANCAPSTLSESGGVYLGFDHQPHILQAPQKAYYSDMSIWVTFSNISRAGLILFKKKKKKTWKIRMSIDAHFL